MEEEEQEQQGRQEIWTKVKSLVEKVKSLVQKKSSSAPGRDPDPVAVMILILIGLKLAFPKTFFRT